MPRQNITTPLSVLLAGVTVIILLLVSSGASTGAVSLQQTRTPVVWTPCGDEDNDCIDFQDNATASAEAYAFASPYAGPASSTATVAGTTTTTTTSRTVTATGTAATPRSTSPQNQTLNSNPKQNLVNAESTPAQADLATPTPTPADTIVCVPGVPVAIIGDGPPRAPVLLYFGERPVGGGSVGPEGRFELKLIVGHERAGEYRVTARVRGTAQVLREVVCTVPELTPTPPPTTR